VWQGTELDRRELSSGPSPVMTGILQDLKYSLRSLTRDPTFVVFAAFTLALGIAGTAAMFSVAYGVLFRPLPYPESQRLVGLWEVHPGANAPLKNDLLSLPTYRAWQKDSGSLEAIGAYTETQQILSDSSVVERVRGAAVTPSLLEMLHIVPSQGRSLTAADAQPGAEPVTVISERLWRRQFGQAPSIIGRTIRLNDAEHLVVGIFPAASAFPTQETGFYIPLAVPPTDPAGRAVRLVTAIGRLKPGATVDQVEAEGTAHARAVERPFANLAFGEGQTVEVRAMPVVRQQTRSVRAAFSVLLIGVGLLLLAAVRGALGATSTDLRLLVLGQGLAITVVGICVGVGAAALFSQGMSGLLFGVRPLDPAAFVWPSLLMIVVACAACLIPASRAARVDPLMALRYE